MKKSRNPGTGKPGNEFPKHNGSSLVTYRETEIIYTSITNGVGPPFQRTTILDVREVRVMVRVRFSGANQNGSPSEWWPRILQTHSAHNVQYSKQGQQVIHIVIQLAHWD